MTMRLWILLMALVFVAGSAWAAGWSRLPSGTQGDCEALRPGSQVTCFYDFADATTDSSALAVSQCRDVNIWLDPDTTTAVAGAKVYIWNCATKTFSSNTCVKILPDSDGDGLPNDVPLDGATLGLRGFQNVQASFLVVEANANAGSDTARVTVECH